MQGSARIRGKGARYCSTRWTEREYMYMYTLACNPYGTRFQRMLTERLLAFSCSAAVDATSWHSAAAVLKAATNSHSSPDAVDIGKWTVQVRNFLGPITTVLQGCLCPSFPFVCAWLTSAEPGARQIFASMPGSVAGDEAKERKYLVEHIMT